VPLWVRGVYYGTRVLDELDVPTNTFTNAEGTVSLTFTLTNYASGTSTAGSCNQLMYRLDLGDEGRKATRE